jgi:translation initiation factor 3 subunit L
MSLQAAIQNGAARRAPEDESDAEEDALVNDYKEQVRYEQDGGLDDLERIGSVGNASNQDVSAQLVAAAQPLEFQATLETKFSSYDNYCSLFHYILNSEGPVDLEVPSVRTFGHRKNKQILTSRIVLLGMGCH